MRARAQAAHHRAEAPAAVVNERDGLCAIAHGNAQSDNFAVNRVKRRMAGAGCGVAGTPFRRAAEVAVCD